MVREEEGAELAFNTWGIFAWTSLARLEMPKLTGVTALAQNYLSLSLNALYQMNQITFFYSKFLFQLAVIHWKEWPPLEVFQGR